MAASPFIIAGQPEPEGGYRLIYVSDGQLHVDVDVTGGVLNLAASGFINPIEVTAPSPALGLRLLAAHVNTR